MPCIADINCFNCSLLSQPIINQTFLLETNWHKLVGDPPSFPIILKHVTKGKLLFYQLYIIILFVKPPWRFRAVLCHSTTIILLLLLLLLLLIAIIIVRGVIMLLKVISWRHLSLHQYYYIKWTHSIYFSLCKEVQNHNSLVL